MVIKAIFGRYVIKKGNKFVAKPGREKSYTTSLDNAAIYDSFEEAKANACDDEWVHVLDFSIE